MNELKPATKCAAYSSESVSILTDNLNISTKQIAYQNKYLSCVLIFFKINVPHMNSRPPPQRSNSAPPPQFENVCFIIAGGPTSEF
jgi:hypothetical protein